MSLEDFESQSYYEKRESFTGLVYGKTFPGRVSCWEKSNLYDAKLHEHMSW